MDDLSNGILRDPRAFFMAEPDKWVKMYDRQGKMDTVNSTANK